MNRPTDPVDDGYRTGHDIVRGCEYLASSIAGFQEMLATAVSPASSAKQRSDAFHYLQVHGPALLPEARRLSRAASVILRDTGASP